MDGIKARIERQHEQDRVQERALRLQQAERIRAARLSEVQDLLTQNEFSHRLVGAILKSKPNIVVEHMKVATIGERIKKSTVYEGHYTVGGLVHEGRSFLHLGTTAGWLLNDALLPENTAVSSGSEGTRDVLLTDEGLFYKRAHHVMGKLPVRTFCTPYGADAATVGILSRSGIPFEKALPTTLEQYEEDNPLIPINSFPNLSVPDAKAKQREVYSALNASIVSFAESHTMFFMNGLNIEEIA